MGNEDAAKEVDYHRPAEVREVLKQAKAEDIAMRQHVKATIDEQTMRRHGEWLRAWMMETGSGAERPLSPSDILNN